MLVRAITTTAHVLYCGVIIIICGSFLKGWYDAHRFDIRNAVSNARMKIGL